MEPHLSKNDKMLFYKYLDIKTVYFEYGSGGSTIQANIRDNIKKIYSVESDIIWKNAIQNNISKTNITYFFNEMDTVPNTWGYPGKNATDLQRINYSNHIRNLNKEDRDAIDLIFIDGRFRVACCLKCFDIMNNDCVIAFDDFLDRPKYHIVLDYFNIVEQTSDNRMVILKKKMDVSVPHELITKYEIIAD